MFLKNSQNTKTTNESSRVENVVERKKHIALTRLSEWNGESEAAHDATTPNDRPTVARLTTRYLKSSAELQTTTLRTLKHCSLLQTNDVNTTRHDRHPDASCRCPSVTQRAVCQCETNQISGGNWRCGCQAGRVTSVATNKALTVFC